MFISPRHFCSQLFIKITETMDVKNKLKKSLNRKLYENVYHITGKNPFLVM